MEKIILYLPQRDYSHWFRLYTISPYLTIITTRILYITNRIPLQGGWVVRKYSGMSWIISRPSESQIVTSLTIGENLQLTLLTGFKYFQKMPRMLGGTVIFSGPASSGYPAYAQRLTCSCTLVATSALGWSGSADGRHVLCAPKNLPTEVILVLLHYYFAEVLAALRVVPDVSKEFDKSNSI